MHLLASGLPWACSCEKNTHDQGNKLPGGVKIAGRPVVVITGGIRGIGNGWMSTFCLARPMLIHALLSSLTLSWCAMQAKSMMMESMVHQTWWIAEFCPVLAGRP